MDRDRNLLFGVFAVQLKKATPSEIMAAAGAWAADQSNDLSSILEDMGALDDTDRRLIQGLVEHAVNEHGGDVAATLNTFGGAAQVQQSFCGSIVITDSGGVAQTVVGKPMDEKVLPESVRAVQETPGRYTYVGEHGRGGMGRVLLVHDEYLGRDVALKELLPGPGSSATGEPGEESPMGQYMSLAARFLLEARITGQMEHPSIIPVYELGHRPDGRLYYTMKLVRGKTLREAIGEAESLEDRLSLLPHFVDLCQAIAYAHSCRVIHRDIKPANVMVGAFGETVVLDWGLAKSIGGRDVHADGMVETIRLMRLGDEDALEKTNYGQIMGTPVYIPPEQANGRLDLVDERSDVYSLGAVLYELLVGKPPYGPGRILDILEQVLTSTPAPVSTIDARIPHELEDICERAMNKDPDARYASARELADDIQRFLSGALVQAHEYRTSELVLRFVKRHRPLVATAAMAVVLLLAVTGVYIRGINVANRELSVARIDADDARDVAESTLYKSNILLATTLIPDSEYLSAEQALWQTPERLRGWEWGYLLRTCHPEMRRFTLPTGALANATLSPDGRLLALGGVTGGLTVVDYETGSERYRVADGALQRTTARFSADGAYMLATIDGEAARLCDAQSGELLQTFGDLRGLPQKMSAISPTSTEIALMVDFPNARVITFSIESAKVLHDVDNGQDLFHSIAYSPDGTEIVAGTQDGNTLIIDAARGAVVEKLKRNNSTILAARFRSDGMAILTGSASGAVRLWSRGSGETIWEHEAYDAAVEAVAFQPSGSLVAAGLRDGSVRVLASANGEEIGRLRGHAGTVTDVSFVEGGDSILSASRDGTARVWRLDSALRTARVPIAATASSAMDVSADAALVAVSPQSPSGSRRVEVYDADSGEERLAIAGIGGHINHVRFSPGGDLIGVSSGRGAFVFDSDSGELVQAFHGHQSETAEIRFAPDGGTAAIGYWDGSVQIRDVATGGIVQALAGLEALVRCAAYSPDGRLIAAGDDAGLVKIWNASDGSVVNQLSIPESKGIRGLTFDSNGNNVWIGGRDSTLRSWNLKTGNSFVYPPTHAGSVRDLALSPDDERLASTFGDETVRVFDSASGEELLRFSGQGVIHCGIAWSSDGMRLLHLDEDGNVAIREADPWRARDLGTDGGYDWQERYARFKLAERAQAQPTPTDGGPTPQIVSMPALHMAARFERLRSIAAANGNDFQTDLNGETGMRIDSDALFPAVRDFGLVPGDVITHWDGEPVGDWDRSRVISGDDAIPSSLTVVRNGRIRALQFRAVDLFRETLHATMETELLKFGLASVDDLRAVSDEATRIQRRYSENIDLPVKGEGIDGLWVMPMGEDVNDDTTKVWAILLNGLFGSIGLRDGDHVVEINRTPIDSIETVAKLIEAAGPAMEAGEPYEFVIIIDRSLFHRIELHLEVGH